MKGDGAPAPKRKREGDPAIRPDPLVKYNPEQLTTDELIASGNEFFI